MGNSPMYNLQNIKAAHAVQNRKKIFLMGRRPRYTFLQNRHTDGQETQEKMLNITTY